MFEGFFRYRYLFYFLSGVFAGRIEFVGLGGVWRGER